MTWNSLLKITFWFLAIQYVSVFGYPNSFPDSEGVRRIDDMLIVDNPDPRAAFVGYKWPNKTVIYNVKPSVSAETLATFQRAIGRLSKTSGCIIFRTKTDADKYWVDLTSDRTGCFATVGWQNRAGGASQTANFANGCSEGNIVHEMMHCLGFFHEQARDDRDSYVSINYTNIQVGKERNFEKTKDRGYTTEDYGQPYNYESIMHYGATFFAKDPKYNTINVVNPRPVNAVGNTANMGQRARITDVDATMMNARYCQGQGQPQNDPAPTDPNEKHQPEGPDAEYPPGSENGNGGNSGGGGGAGGSTTGKPGPAMPELPPKPLCDALPQMPICKEGKRNKK